MCKSKSIGLACLLVAALASCSGSSLPPEPSIEEVQQVIAELFAKAQPKMEQHALDYGKDRLSMLVLPLRNRSRIALDATGIELLEDGVRSELVNMAYRTEDAEELLGSRLCRLTSRSRVRTLMQQARIGTALEKLYDPHVRETFVQYARAGGLPCDLLVYVRFSDPLSLEAKSNVLKVSLEVVAMLDGEVLFLDSGDTRAVYQQ
jgi:hypothetical protein